LATLSEPAIAIVEPYLVGTSSHYVSDALTDVPHRLLSIGVALDELRKFGTPEEHISNHGLDTLSLKNKFMAFFKK
jgi:transketolase